ncbi:MAG: hypothetical protein GY846_09975 [Deltaproteobacteria bacterium]|nr:hypothetical protein [Deltaproteobacteria bacterium]
MTYPKIRDIVTTDQALRLCEHFKLDYLVKRIEADPNRYKEWPFDGCSCLPDEIMGLFTGCDWRDITYKCCLPHDLCYGYGEPGNDIERKRVDVKFYSDLVTKAGMEEWQASAFLAGVRLGGAEEFGLSFSWGFAHRDWIAPNLPRTGD